MRQERTSTSTPSTEDTESPDDAASASFAVVLRREEARVAFAATPDVASSAERFLCHV